MDARSGRIVRERSHIDKLVESRAQPRPQRAEIVRPVRIGDDLETGLVVTLEKFGHEKRGRMAAEVGGKIADPELPAPLVNLPRGRKMFKPRRNGRRVRAAIRS